MNNRYEELMYSAFVHGVVVDGRKVVASAGTAEALLAAPVKCRRIVITAETDNTGYVVIGGSTVVAALATRRGIPLAAGQSVTIYIDDASKLWLDVTVSGDGVTYAYFA